MTTNPWILKAVCVATIAFQSCNSTNWNHQRTPGYSFETYVSNLPNMGQANSCNSIDGIYENGGFGKKAGSPHEFQVRIDALMGNAATVTKLPVDVRFNVDSKSMTIKIEYGQAMNLVTYEKFSCIDGWIEMQIFKEGSYVGDGGSFKGAYRVVRLSRNSSKSLLMSVFLIESESRLINPKKDLGEIYNAEFLPAGL